MGKPRVPADRTGHSLLSHNWLVHKIAQRHISEAASFATGTLLDIGCGHKPYLELFKPGVSRYVGLERPETLSASRVVDVYGDGLQVPLGGGSVDTVVSFAVLEHVREPDQMISEVSRVLRPGGFFILTAPHIWGLHEEPDDYFRFTRYGLSHLLEKNGFEIVYIKAMAGYWVTAGQRFSYYLAYYFRVRRIIGRLVPIMTFAVQSMALILDTAHRVESDTWAYIAVARKAE